MEKNNNICPKYMNVDYLDYVSCYDCINCEASGARDSFCLRQCEACNAPILPDIYPDVAANNFIPEPRYWMLPRQYLYANYYGRINPHRRSSNRIVRRR